MTTWMVSGSRSYDNKQFIFDSLNNLVYFEGEPDLVIHGGAHGVDTLAGIWAGGYNIPVTIFPAEWSKYGKYAGPRRNLEMLDSNPDLVVAFTYDASRGTKHVITEARKRGIPVQIYNI